jgi:hypothetical protein
MKKKNVWLSNKNLNLQYICTYLIKFNQTKVKVNLSQA